jgi:hypothetical protein
MPLMRPVLPRPLPVCRGLQDTRDVHTIAIINAAFSRLELEDFYLILSALVEVDAKWSLQLAADLIDASGLTIEDLDPLWNP